MMKAILASAALVALAAAAPAGATVLFGDNFDAQGTVGDSDLQIASLTGWTITGGVDAVYQANGWGITCSGKCIDLDGTSGPGQIVSDVFGFAAGGTVTISFDLSGSQRSSDADDFSFDAYLVPPTDLSQAMLISGFPGAPLVAGFLPGIDNIQFNTAISGATGFTTYSLSFNPLTAGTLQLSFATTSGDNVGPLLDNVLVTQDAVPEPASWAMMIGGLGLVGGTMRRRAAKVRFA